MIRLPYHIFDIRFPLVRNYCLIHSTGESFDAWWSQEGVFFVLGAHLFDLVESKILALPVREIFERISECTLWQQWCIAPNFEMYGNAEYMLCYIKIWKTLVRTEMTPKHDKCLCVHDLSDVFWIFASRRSHIVHTFMCFTVSRAQQHQSRCKESDLHLFVQPTSLFWWSWAISVARTNDLLLKNTWDTTSKISNKDLGLPCGFTTVVIFVESGVSWLQALRFPLPTSRDPSSAHKICSYYQSNVWYRKFDYMIWGFMIIRLED